MADIHKYFNVFLKELVLLAKQYCSTNKMRTGLKRNFKLFDITSYIYIKAFISRMQPACDNADTDTIVYLDHSEVLPKITYKELYDLVPGNKRGLLDALINGLTLYASLDKANAGSGVVDPITSSIISSRPDESEGVIFDDDIQGMLNKVISSNLPSKLSDTLMQQSSAKESSNPMSIFELAKDIGSNLDMSSLISIANGDTSDMGTVMEQINSQVQRKMSDGSINVDQISNEAKLLLSSMS